jgi:hypothetical protein
MMEALRTCETSVYLETTLRYIPEGHRENLISHKTVSESCDAYGGGEKCKPRIVGGREGKILLGSLKCMGK